MMIWKHYGVWGRFIDSALTLTNDSSTEVSFPTKTKHVSYLQYGTSMSTKHVDIWKKKHGDSAHSHVYYLFWLYRMYRTLLGVVVMAEFHIYQNLGVSYSALTGVKQTKRCCQSNTVCLLPHSPEKRTKRPQKVCVGGPWVCTGS